MKYLNLNLPHAEQHEGVVGWKISKFPDGQQQVTIVSSSVNSSDEVTIKSRLNNWMDLELIVCTVVSLKNLGVSVIHLYTPYFVGSRSDRQFEEGGNNYVKQVIAPVINSLEFKTVTVMDPHSDVLEACINNFRKLSNISLLHYVVHDLDREFPGDLFSNIILVSPDAGASKKIFKLAEQVAFTGDIVTCSKSRDEKGKLSHVAVPIQPNETRDIIIIDDICDGGATFENVAGALNDAGHTGKKYLMVTHGIFSKGFKSLSHYFDGIYTTNSYYPRGSMPECKNRDGKEMYNELNVF